MSEPSLDNDATARTAAGAEGARNPASRRRLIRFAVFAVLLTAAFSESLFALAVHVAHSNLHSYILLVPFVWGYLLYNRRNQSATEYRSAPGWVAALLVIGLAVLGAAISVSTLSYNDHVTLIALSFVCLLNAGAFLFLGRKYMANMAFPFAFLIFLVPMPDAVANALEGGLQSASTEAASVFFNLTGTPNLQSGTIFQLPDITIRVGQECSGIRSSWVLLITSLLAANLFLKSSWRRAVLVAAVIPLGIIRNGFRVWVIGTLCIDYGPQMIRSIIHRRGGPVFFALSLIPLFLLLWWLWRGEARKGRGQRSEGRGQRAEVRGQRTED